jgi:hypothetical protein
MRIPKRDFLKQLTAGAMALGANLGSPPLHAAETRPVPLKNDSLFRFRGFNYQPSYGAHGLEIWKHFQRNLVEKELQRGKELFPDMTALRIWLSLDAYLAAPKEVPKNVATMIDLANKIGVKVMPVLISGWHGVPDFGGICVEMAQQDLRRYYSPYLDAMVDPFLGDERIIAWDLCNEPYQSGGEQVMNGFLNWSHTYLKNKDPRIRTTVASCYEVGKLEVLSRFSDILSIHPYRNSPETFDAFVNLANAQNKPMLATEIGWGSLDDAERIRFLEPDLIRCTERRIGFMIHALHHSLVADLHLPGYGPVMTPGYMGCINPDGSLRPHHGMINRYLAAAKQ